MANAYQVAPVFLIRLAGVPFDVVERLVTHRAVALAREIFARGSAAMELRAADTDLRKTLEHELDVARRSLVETARAVLPGHLVFGSNDAASLLSHLPELVSTRNNRARGREQHLLLYLQRIATKNDTFSEFGPSGWGKINQDVSGMSVAPEPGIARRDAFLERWCAHAVAAAINADPENSHPQLAVPSLEPYAFAVLCDDVEKWSPGPARDKWLSILRPIAELPRKFIATIETKDRREILDEARTRLQAIGVERPAGERFLYAAVNPIGEECFRECHFDIAENLINQVAVEAEPWIDLWRDSYAFIASRVAAGLRPILESGAKNGAMPLPAFLQACEAAKLPLAGPGLVALAVMAFQEVKAAFRKRLQPHVDLSEYELSPEDCHVVRDSFDYPKFDEYTYPSADLQLAAASPEAVARGAYRWILAELHPPAALLHHCMYWACPDKNSLHDAFARAAAKKPNFHFGFFAADFTAHTTVRIFDALPQLSNFVAPQRGNPKWKTVRPGDAEVYVDEASGDVCLRKIDNRENLGSFARAWLIPLGFHPFQFGISPHTPRLRCGNVIVQRRTWTVTLEELPAGDFTGVSRHLILAVEQLRSQRDLPRHIYIRPTEQALRRSGAEGRDKDTKPVYIDLESYLFLEIFYRWLHKAGELEITEMLPAPDDLLWREADGRRTFELRTLIVPRS